VGAAEDDRVAARSWSGAAYPRTASTVCAPASISGTRSGQATALKRTPASSVRTSASYRPAVTVACVASSPILRFRVVRTAAYASA